MDSMLRVLLSTVDRLLIAQGKDPAVVTQDDKLFIATEHVEVYAVNYAPTPQEDTCDPVPDAEPV